jgi:hypothetical protein
MKETVGQLTRGVPPASELGWMLQNTSSMQHTSMLRNVTKELDERREFFFLVMGSGKINEKFVLRKYGVKMWTCIKWLRQKPVSSKFLQTQ